MYLDGQGVAQDYSKAYFWLRKAADQGNPDALNDLGYMYANGKGMPKDPKKGFELYLQAAEKGNVIGTAQCGPGYYDGDGRETGLQPGGRLVSQGGRSGRYDLRKDTWASCVKMEPESSKITKRRNSGI